MINKNITKKMYDKFSKEYHEKVQNSDDNFWNRFIERPAMKSLLEGTVNGKEVLDLGCGSGISTAELASWGANVVGLDFSKELIDIAKKENPKIKFYVGDAQKTPFDNSQFDLVSSSLMVHHIKDLKSLFEEVARILKNNGTFIFSIHHPITFKSTTNSEYLLLPYFHNNEYSWEMLKGMELLSYHHTFESIINSLNDVGFVVERLLEPKPVIEAEKFDKQSYDKTTNYPSFCIIKAKKI